MFEMYVRNRGGGGGGSHRKRMHAYKVEGGVKYWQHLAYVLCE